MEQKHTFLIVDVSNMFHRARHSVPKASDIWTKVGFAIHVTLQSLLKCWRTTEATHTVFCLDGTSWRKQHYAPYKKNREALRAKETALQKEEHVIVQDAFANFMDFVRTKSNATVLWNQDLEADDLIAGWIQSHPNDNHVILSSDSDYHQLLAENVQQYDGIKKEFTTVEGVFDENMKAVIDKKTNLPAKVDSPELLLFMKCIRGDTSDNIFSAYPGAPVKSSKKRIGLMEAYEDRKEKGFAWNAIMQHTWEDHNGEVHKVLDDFNRNNLLIDLTAQPDDIKQKIAETIAENAISKDNMQIGSHFLKFCAKHELNKIAEYHSQYVKMLSASYNL